MRAWVWGGLAALLAAALFLRAQNDDAPPPAIGQDGVVNAASQLPPEFAAGALAPGARIRIHGWRLGPAKEVRAPSGTTALELGGMSVEIRKGTASARLALESVSANLIEAMLPLQAPAGQTQLPMGQAQLIVKHGEDASLPAAVRIAASAFGAYAVNDLGWGPGKFLNAGLTGGGFMRNAARPGQVVTLLGTGTGTPTGAGAEQAGGITVLVGGKAARATAIRNLKGEDELAFTLPPGVPEGCYVPVQARGAAAAGMPMGVASNVVTIAVSRKGGACSDPGNWMREQLGEVDRAGLLMLLDADVLLALDPSDRVHYHMNAAFGAFVKGLREPDQITPLYALPPAGTCTGYTRTVRLRGLLASVSPFQMLGGIGIDAGQRMTVSRGATTKTVAIARGHERGFAQVIGGSAPVPNVTPSPVFLSPGTYAISGGGDAVGPFHAAIPVGQPLRWTNRDKINIVDRARGVVVEWTAGRADDFVAIVAINAENDSGALGMSLCVAPAGAGRFAIPPEALTNIPPTTKVGDVPLNAILVVELPGKLPESFTATGIERGVAYAVSASSRTVEYR